MMTKNRKTSAVLMRTAAVASVGLLCSAALLPSPGEDDIGETRSVLEKWVDTRRVLSLEQRDWTLGREILNSRVDVLQREIDSLTARQRDVETSIADADKKRAELVADNDRLKQSSSALAAMVGGFESRTRDLLRRSPDPIRDRVKPLSQRIPEPGTETKLSLSERFQNVVGILNEVDKFARDITTTSEVRESSDGSASEVTAVYLGLGQGYYASANGLRAGVGTASPEGWTWTAANDSAPAISRVIAILKNESVADFVPLPMRIQ
jgi:FtsZ-binding cell division protein ZapB